MDANAAVAPEDLLPARLPAPTPRGAIAWPDLARAIDRNPKDGTARRLRDDLLASGELCQLDDGRLQRGTGVGTPDKPHEQAGSGQRCHGATTPKGGPADGTPGDDSDARPATPEEDAEVERIATKFGLSTDGEEAGP
jgi:hypothetical protein